jgi:hypothetical protein
VNHDGTIDVKDLLQVAFTRTCRSVYRHDIQDDR